MAQDAPRSVTPKEFGDELRRLREVAGVSLEDIASETKINPHVLRCLEEGRFSRLPQRVFCRNFVRQIAATIGCDAERLVTAFDAAWNRYQLSSGSHPTIRVEEAPPPRVIRLWVWVPVALAVVVLVIATLMVLGARSARAPAGVRGVPSPPAPPARPTTPPLPPPARAEPEEPAAARVELAVEVLPGEECWVRVRDGLGRAEQRLLGGGQSWAIRGPGPIQLTLGNAAAAVVSLAGRRYERLGDPGEVLHFRATAQGLEPVRGGRIEDGGGRSR